MVLDTCTNRLQRVKGKEISHFLCLERPIPKRRSQCNWQWNSSHVIDINIAMESCWRNRGTHQSCSASPSLTSSWNVLRREFLWGGKWRVNTWLFWATIWGAGKIIRVEQRYWRSLRSFAFCFSFLFYDYYYFFKFNLRKSAWESVLCWWSRLWK